MANGEISETTENNCIELVKYLMKKYNIDINHIVRHYDASRKICPNWSADNWARWWSFKDKIKNDKLEEQELLVNRREKPFIGLYLVPLKIRKMLKSSLRS